MSIPMQNLDDKTFDQLVEEAKKLIPLYSQQWTDYNWSDPGITFIDLFAWLTEMMLYRINTVTDRHRLKYLKLLGFSPRPLEAAKVDITFIPEIDVSIRMGTEVSAKIDASGKSISFELDDNITITPVTLEKVIVDTRRGIFNYTHANKKADSFYPPFGLDIRKDCALYLGFDDLENRTKNRTKSAKFNTLSFMCYLYENDLCMPGVHGDEHEYKFENANLRWEFTSDGIDWNIAKIKDGTDGLTKSGRIIFDGLNGWEKSKNPLESEGHKLYWLRCVVENSSFEYLPRIETIRLNTVSATHGRTIKDDTMESGRKSNGLPNQVFRLKNIPMERSVRLAIVDNSKEVFNWTRILENDYEKLMEFMERKFEMGMVKKENFEKIDDDMIIYSGKKSFTLARNFEKNLICLKINEECTYELFLKDGSAYDWIWREVDDFDRSGRDDHNYILNKEKREIKFGDGLYGKVPPSGSEINVIQYRTGGGEEGNIRQGYEWSIKDANRLLIKEMTNCRPSSGGKEAESIDEATRRFISDLKVPYTAVTSSDFERITRNTPGLRVASAKAIPERNDKNCFTGTVKLAVIPFTLFDDFNKEPPGPSGGFTNAICEHIERHRLLGTKVKVVSPIYVKVNVSVTIAPLKGFSESKIKEDVREKLRNYLHPVKGGYENNGWLMGRIVSRSEIYDTIRKVPGVGCVTGLILSGDKGSSLKKGNLELPSEIATVYPGNLNVDVTTDVGKCSQERCANG